MPYFELIIEQTVGGDPSVLIKVPVSAVNERAARVMGRHWCRNIVTGHPYAGEVKIAGDRVEYPLVAGGIVCELKRVRKVSPEGFLHDRLYVCQPDLSETKAA